MNRIRMRGWTVPVALGLVTIASFGVLARWLGYYWDDWAFAWISHTFGPAGLARYFSTNRPVWGLIYRLTTPILGQNPLSWQLFAIFFRWLSAVALWWALASLWPQRKGQVVWIALLYLVYPGFGQQSIAITYGHFFVVLSVFFFSIGGMLWSIRRPEKYGLFTALSLLGAAVNLFSLEYFFGLDLLRGVFVWILLGEMAYKGRARLLRTLRYWSPYLALTMVYAFWRAFIFKFQTYQPDLINNLSASPAASALGLIQTALGDIYQVSVGAWLKVLQPPALGDFGLRSTIVYWGLIVLCAAAVAMYLYFIGRHVAGSSAAGWRQEAGWSLELILTGLLALALGGMPFWLTSLKIGLVFPNNRFTVPMMLGAGMLLAGLVNLIPRARWLQVGLLGIAIGLAVGVQYQNGTSFRRDWNAQKTFFWQLSWRAPGIQPGTTLLIEDTPFQYESDNSLTAPLNWMYAADNKTQQMSYLFYFISLRQQQKTLTLQPGIPIHDNYLAAQFDGSTSQALVLYYNPPACVRILDPRYDADIPVLPRPISAAIDLSRPELVLANADPPAHAVGNFFDPEPAHGWCYYFEKADLAREQADWAEIARLGDLAFQLNDHPNDASERVVFIEGYAHTSDWQKA
jgi:hypothetical protein